MSGRFTIDPVVALAARAGAAAVARNVRVNSEEQPLRMNEVSHMPHPVGELGRILEHSAIRREERSWEKRCLQAAALTTTSFPVAESRDRRIAPASIFKYR